LLEAVEEMVDSIEIDTIRFPCRIFLKTKWFHGVYMAFDYFNYRSDGKGLKKMSVHFPIGCLPHVLAYTSMSDTLGIKSVWRWLKQYVEDIRAD
jgi:hypothetical protein